MYQERDVVRGSISRDVYLITDNGEGFRYTCIILSSRKPNRVGHTVRLTTGFRGLLLGHNFKWVAKCSR